MFDRDTLVISYDAGRGDPRGSRRRGADHRAAGLGDCIDCTLCVQACPTGIDIRDGLQYECIACAACIDACDQVMDRMDYPKGLIRYTTRNAMDGRPTRVVRPRTLIYAGGLAALTAVFAGSLALRIPAELDVIRDRNALYRETDEGLIRNVYTLKIVNMHDEPLRWRVGASGIEGLRLEGERGDREVAPGEVASVPVRLDAPREALRTASTPVRFTVEAIGAEDIQEIILCTNPNTEGEVTAMYLARLLKPLGLTVTRIASGLPVGGDLEYADELTLGRALEGRRAVEDV